MRPAVGKEWELRRKRLSSLGTYWLRDRKITAGGRTGERAMDGI